MIQDMLNRCKYKTANVAWIQTFAVQCGERRAFQVRYLALIRPGRHGARAAVSHPIVEDLKVVGVVHWEDVPVGDWSDAPCAYKRQRTHLGC